MSVQLAVIYCRVSTKEQVGNMSLSTQQKACEQWCARLNYAVDRIFIEEGESAKTANRTQLQKLLVYCRENKGRVKIVIVYAVNRFARAQYDHAILRAQLAKLGISLRSVTEPIDDTSMGKLMEGMLASFAQFDNDVRAERTTAGMKARLEHGGWTFKPPLGYVKSVEASGRKTLAPDPIRAPLVIEAFQMFATGQYTKRQVLDKITAVGLRTKAGKKLSPQSFGQMLGKPIYAGRIEVRDWGAKHRANFPQLVSDDTFDAVQLLLRGKRPSLRPRSRNHPDFPLRHFVRCGACDRPLTAAHCKGRSKRYAYYFCQNHVCRAVNTRREQFEQAFIDFLGTLSPKPGYLRLFTAIILDVWKEKKAAAAKITAALRKNVSELKLKKQRLVDLLCRQVIDDKTYAESVDKLDEELALAELEEGDAQIEEMDIEGALHFATHVVSDAARLWCEFDVDQKQRLQVALFPEGVTFLDGVYRTRGSLCVFFEMQKKWANKECLVALPGIEPGFED
ncbi:MAG: recombinase family protein [Terriglobales bacterium]